MPEILLSIFIVSVVLGMTLAALMLIGCSIYDIAQTQEKRRPTKLSKWSISRYKPFVSIVIPAFNEELTIQQCLDNLKKIRYRKLEIIVSDDKSTDDTRKIVREYIKRHPKREIKLVAKRRNGGRGAAINLGVKHAKGEIIVALDADCYFEPDSIHKLAARFADKEVAAVAANVRIQDDGTVLGMLQRLEYLVSFRSKKFNTITKSEFIVGGAGAAYRASILEKTGKFDESMKTEDIELSMRMIKKLGIASGLVYASDYVVHTQPAPTITALLRQRYRWKFGTMQAVFKNRQLLFSMKREHNPFMAWVRLPFSLWSEIMLLLEPLLFSFFIFLAISGKNPWLFISASLAYTVIVWLAVWSDEHYKPRTKIYLSALAPSMYLSSIIMSLVQVAAAFRSLINFRGIVGLKQVRGSYITTQRSKKLGVS